MSENFESTYESTIKNGHYLGTEIGANVAENSSQDFWQEYGISPFVKPSHSSDTIAFTGSRIPGGLGEDHISFASQHI